MELLHVAPHTQPAKMDLRMMDTQQMLRLSIFGAIQYDEQSRELIEMIRENTSRPIELMINSPGGNFHVGLEIMQAIKAHGNVTAFITGMAASMAAHVTLAAQRVKVVRGGRFMIHFGSTTAKGKVEDLMKTVNELQRANGDALEQAMRKATKPREEIEMAMREERWLKDDEIVEYGFADEVVDVQMRTDDMQPLGQSTSPNNTPPTPKVTNMEFSVEVKNRLGKPTASDQDALNFVDELVKKNQELEYKLQEQDKTQQKLTERLKAMEAKEKQALEQRVITLLDGAVEAGKIDEAERDEYKQVAEKAGVEFLAKQLDKLPGTAQLDDVIDDSSIGGGGSGSGVSQTKFKADTWKEMRAMAASEEGFRELKADQKGIDFLHHLREVEPAYFQKCEDNYYGA